MTESNLIYEGLVLMLTGMGMVFVFLSILVFFTSILNKIFGAEELVEVSRREAASSNEDEIAAASAAVYAFRKKHLKR